MRKRYHKKRKSSITKRTVAKEVLNIVKELIVSVISALISAYIIHKLGLS